MAGPSDYLRHLLKEGWWRSEQRAGWVSRDGRFIADEDMVEAARSYGSVRDGDNVVIHFGSGIPQALPQPRDMWSFYDKLKMRLGLNKQDTFDIDHCHIVEGRDSVHVFLVHNDQALIISDSASLFPSDAMIAKYRLFKEAVS